MQHTAYSWRTFGTFFEVTRVRNEPSVVRTEVHEHLWRKSRVIGDASLRTTGIPCSRFFSKNVRCFILKSMTWFASTEGASEETSYWIFTKSAPHTRNANDSASAGGPIEKTMVSEVESIRNAPKMVPGEYRLLWWKCNAFKMPLSEIKKRAKKIWQFLKANKSKIH